MIEFADYLIQVELGRGATGIVYRASRQRDGLTVALKVLDPVLAESAADWVRLDHEASVMALVAHPNCVQLYDHGRDPAGAWIAMEYVPGASLRAVLASHGPLSPEQSCGVLRGALAGLGHAHQLGVIHRDVKPENVLVDRTGVSKLADFGLTAWRGDASGWRSIEGSPAYLSPEQAQGLALDQRSDLYSATVVLYELLTGRLPAVAENPYAMLHAQVAGPLPPVDGLPSALGALVLRGLAKDRSERPASAEEFAAQLEDAARRDLGPQWWAAASIAGLVGGVAATMVDASPAAAAQPGDQPTASEPGTTTIVRGKKTRRLRATRRSKVAMVTAAVALAGLAAALGAVAGRSHSNASVAVVPVVATTRTVCSNIPSITVTSHETWGPSKASSYLVGCLVKIASGGSLTIEPGTVVKLGSQGLGDAFYVGPGGSVDVAGTAAHPVIITSFRDDSVGGDTAPAGSPPPLSDYYWAFSMDGHSSLRVSHAVIRYGVSSIAEGNPSGACAAAGHIALSVSESVLTSPITLGACDSASGSRYRINGNVLRITAGTTAISDNGNSADSLSVASNAFDFTGPAATVAIDISNSPANGFVMSGPTTNTFAGGAGHAGVTVQLSNASIPAGTTWAAGPGSGAGLTGQIDVDGRATLQAGMDILNGAQFQVGSDGSLRADGRPDSPVRFADGSAIFLDGEGSLYLDHAVFGGDRTSQVIGEVGCPDGDNGVGGEAVTIKDSTFGGALQLGACDSKGGDSYTIVGNRFEVPVGITALDLTVPDLHFPSSAGRLVVASNIFDPTPDVQGYQLPVPLQPEIYLFGWAVDNFALSGASSNVLIGSGTSRVVSLDDVEIPAGSSWKVSPTSGAVFNPSTDYERRPGLRVDGQLILDPGLAVKITVGTSAGGIDLGSGGSLVAIGTASAPITFTSMNDDSIAGASNGEQSSTPTQRDYSTAVQADEGSSVDVSHSIFRYGLYAFYDQCSASPEPNGRFGLTDSLVDDEISLGDCNGSQEGYVPQLEGNTFDFDGAPSGNFAAGGGYDPAALQPAVFLYNVDPSLVALSGLTSNRFEGSGAGRVVALAGTVIPPGESWTVSPASRAVLAPWPDTDYLASPGITVQGTLTLDAGDVVKVAIPSIGIDVDETGTLAVDGTATNPVVFTAIADDTLAGISNGDASAPAPKPGAYGEAIQYEHVLNGRDDISHAVFEYANDAIYVKYLDYFMTISDTDWAENVKGIDVEQTSGPDYKGLGNLTCVLPWLAQIGVSHDWFAPHGPPAPDIDLSSVVGLKFPVSGLISLEEPLFGQGNTVPWTFYSCLKVTVPVTAVDVTNTPGAPNFATTESKS